MEGTFRRLDPDLARVARDRDPGIPDTAHVYLLAADLREPAIAVLREALERLSASDATSVERWIERLSPEMEIPEPAVLLQARQNAELQTRFLQEFGALTPARVAELTKSRASNRAQAAHALRKAGRIFAVTHHGATYYPGFQFDADGRPLPVIKAVLDQLRTRFSSDWQIASWFADPNSWLDGRRPVDLLLTDPRAVVEAARLGADRSGL